MPKKNPWIAAILNLLLWGLGYLYNGKRIALGVLLLIGDLILNFATLYWSTLTLLSAFLPFLLISIGLAYDGYKEAQEINKRK